MKLSILIVAVAPLFIASVASAQEAPSSPPAPLESRGHLFFDRIVGLGFGPSAVLARGSTITFNGLVGYQGITSDEYPGPGGPTVTRAHLFWLNPSLDYVFAERFTIGAALSLVNVNQRDSGASTAETSYFSAGAVPRIGYIRDVARDLAVWARFGAGGSVALNGPYEAGTTIEIDGDVSVVLRAGRYLMATIGPAVRYVRRKNGDHAALPGVFGSSSVGIGANAGLGLVF